jgi:hypothetical protein
MKIICPNSMIAIHAPSGAPTDCRTQDGSASKKCHTRLKGN